MADLVEGVIVAVLIDEAYRRVAEVVVPRPTPGLVRMGHRVFSFYAHTQREGTRPTKVMYREARVFDVEERGPSSHGEGPL